MNDTQVDIKSLNEKIEKESAFVDLLQIELGKPIVGQQHMLERLLIGLLGEGHSRCAWACRNTRHQLFEQSNQSLF
jgi:hypothetical protein